MSAPIELIRGNDRQTVYSEAKADALSADGWQRVRDLPKDKQDELRSRPPAPWKGYDDMGVADVLAQAQGLPPQRVEEVVRYESATKGRVSVIDKLLGRRPAPSEAAPAEPVVAEAPKPAEVTEVKEAPKKGK